MNLCQCTIRQNGVFDLNKDSQFSLQCSLGVTGRMKHTKVCIIHLKLTSQPKKKPNKPKTKQKTPTTSKLSQLFSVICQAVLDALLCSMFVAKYFFYPDRQAQRKGAAMWELMLTLVIFKGVFLEASFIVHVDTVEI